MKTAQELGLSANKFEALVKTLALFESGNVRHVEVVSDYKGDGDGFNMNWWDFPNPCRSVHCIGGWAEKIGNVDFLNDCLPRALNELFFPPQVDSDDWSIITMGQATAALRSYLETGDPQWSNVMVLLP